VSARTLFLALALGAPLTLGPAPARADEPKKQDPAKQNPAPAPPPSPAPAKPAESPAADPASSDQKPEEEKEALPSLDEMLGLESNTDAETRKLLDDYDPDKVQLERKLTAQEAAEQLQQAVQQMHESAFRLEEIRDSGIVTQRLQAEILAKLDVLLKNAESQSSSSSSSSSSQSQQQSQNQQMPTKNNQGQESPEPGATGDNDHLGGPAFKEGQREQFDAAKASWGALPERVRDRLMEVSSDDFSEWYRALTEAYYKAIAEEATK